MASRAYPFIPSNESRSRKEMFPECIPVATLDRVIVPKLGANAKRVHEPKGTSEPRRVGPATCTAGEGTRAFTTRQRLLSADQYEIVDVRTDRGMTRAMLFPKAILKAEWDAAAPLRDALTIRRERWRGLRLEKGKNGQRPDG